MFKLSKLLRCLLIICIISTQLTDASLQDSPEEESGQTSSIEHQRMQAEEYLKKLRERKEQWVDPYDMLKSKENFNLLPEKTHKVSTVSLTSKQALDNDFKPTFSDIRGEVIDGKSVADDLPTADHEKDSGKILSDIKQEIGVLDSIYVTRWLKKLIMKLKSDSNLEPSSISFPINSDSLEMLQKISESKSLDISDLDDLLCEFINEATVANQKGIDWDSLSPTAMYIIWIGVTSLVILCFIYCLYICLVYHTKLTVLWGFISISVFWHWMHLYRQKIAHKHAEISALTMSKQCERTDMGIFDHVSFYLKNIFTSGDCKRYYEALMVDPIYEVSFSLAVSDTAATVLFHPLEVFARAINSSLNHLFHDLSIFSIIPIILFIFILAVMLCKYKIKLPFFLGSFEPSDYPTGSGIEELKKTSKPKRFLSNNVKYLVNIDPMVVNANTPRLKHRCNSKHTVLDERNDNHCQAIEGHCKIIETCGIASKKNEHKILGKHGYDVSNEISASCCTELVDDFEKVQKNRTENAFSSGGEDWQCCCMKDIIEEKNCEACIVDYQSSAKITASGADKKTLLSFDQPKHIYDVPACMNNFFQNCCDKKNNDVAVKNDEETM